MSYRVVQQNNTNYGGVGFLGLLTIVFITLQLVGVISWPWIWVLSPLWIGFAIWLVFFIIALIFVAIIS